MKMLVFGTGMIVNDFLQGYKELNLEKVYLCGRNKEKVDVLVDKFDLDQGFYDVEAALQSDADVAYVGLPNNLHFEYAKLSLEAGKNVIVEKPFMTNESECIKIWDIAKNCKKMIFEAALVFYFPAYKAMVEDLPTLGEIHNADLNFSQYSSRYERFLNDDIAPALNIENCGGALMDLNVYNVNLLVGLFGKPKKCQYFATIKKNIDVSGTALLDYGCLKANCVASKSTSAPRHVIFQGEKGMLHLPSSMSRAYEYKIEYNDGKVCVRDFRDGHHRMFHEFREFFQIIENNDRNMCEKIMNRSFQTLQILDDLRACESIVFESDK